VKTGDTNKQYTKSTNSSTAPSPPIRAGSFTSFVISPTADNMCDLYNSFIEADLTIRLQANFDIPSCQYGGIAAPEENEEEEPNADKVFTQTV
jgi:hypothetical protein